MHRIPLLLIFICVGVVAQVNWPQQRQPFPQFNRAKGLTLQPKQGPHGQRGNSDSNEKNLIDPSQCPVIDPKDCPCLRTPGSSECIPYDAQSQAVTLEDAYENFQDPTDPLGRTAKQQGKLLLNTTDPDTDGCNTDFIKGLLAAGADNADVQKLMRRLGVNATSLSRGSNNSRCKWRSLRGMQDFADLAEQATGTEINQCIAKLERPSSGIGSLLGRFSDFASQHNRGKRQSTIGQSYTISCVNRGEVDSQSNDNFVGLCNMCWSWRVLPSDYYPRYVNELQCTNDKRCLRGYGECKQRHRNLNVLRNNQPVTISSAIGCDCKVAVGSPLYTWIAG